MKIPEILKVLFSDFISKTNRFLPSIGSIEIVNSIHLIVKGNKVGASEATLLNMLNISPFTYGMKIQQVYDSGTVFAPEILDITNEDLISKFLQGVQNISAVCLAIGYPTIASVPHSIANGVKNLIAIAIEADVDLKEAQKAKDYLADPSKFVVAAAPAAGECWFFRGELDDFEVRPNSSMHSDH